MQTGAQGAQVAVEAFSRHLPRCPGIVDPRVKELSGDKYMDKYGYGSIPISTIFRGMNIHLPAILMFTRGTRFWHTAIWVYHWNVQQKAGLKSRSERFDHRRMALRPILGSNPWIGRNWGTHWPMTHEWLVMAWSVHHPILQSFCEVPGVVPKMRKAPNYSFGLEVVRFCRGPNSW